MLLGPKTNIKHGLIGGATNSFGSLIDFIDRSNDDLRVINTKSYFGPFSKVTNPLRVLFSLLINGWWANVIFLNSSRGGTKYLAPIAFYISRICGAKFVFRPFGGDIKDYTKSYTGLSKWFLEHATLKVDLLFLQTQSLINFYQSKSMNVKQLITSRKRPILEAATDDNTFQKRILYLGFVNEAKGIDYLIQAAKKLKDEYTIHIFGPIQDQEIEKKLKEFPSLYQGVVNRNQVYATISKYDIVILPSFYEGEGYPGAIIEAYAMGKPVIASKWRAIPEIVKDGETGILIETRSVTAIVEGIRTFDDDNYNSFSLAAKQYFNDKFDEEIVLGKAIEEIKKLFKKEKE